MEQQKRSFFPVVVLAVLVISSALSGCHSSNAKSAAAAAPSGPPSAVVRVAKAQLRDIPVEWRGVGSVEAFTTISVKAQVGGQLIKVLFKDGDFVKQGQTLFEIQPKPFLMAVQQWEANLARDQANQRQAEANLARDIAQERYYRQQAERYAQLTKEGIFSKEQADQMLTEANARAESVRADRAAIESAKAAIVADEAALEVARVQLGYCSIKSPIDGRTGDLKLQLGNLVKATDVELVTIHQVQPVYVTFSVPEANLSMIKEGMKSGSLKVTASVANAPDVKANGKLVFIDNGVDPTTGTIRLKAEFPNTGSGLWPGQFADVVLRLSERKGMVTIPAASVQTGQSGTYVYVVKADNTADMRAVVTAQRLDREIAIDKGLAADETVVTEGQIRLAPGSKVRIIP